MKNCFLFAKGIDTTVHVICNQYLIDVLQKHLIIKIILTTLAKTTLSPMVQKPAIRKKMRQLMISAQQNRHQPY